MKELLRVSWIALGASMLWASACGSNGGSGTTTNGTSTGTGGSATGTGGASTSGSGGASSSSSSSSGAVMCGVDEKLCGATCRLTADPSAGCADPSCAPCTNDHGTTACAGGACAPACYLGWADCDGDPKNGCEHDVIGDAQSCGACGNACPAGFVCEQGTCSCGGDGAACDGGAMPGTFACPAVTGPDVCTCGGATCAAGQRCQADGMCG